MYLLTNFFNIFFFYGYQFHTVTKVTQNLKLAMEMKYFLKPTEIECLVFNSF